MTRVLIAGGGTGGHLYPALAIEAALRALRADLQSHFVGARRGLEARVLPERGVAHTLLPMEPIRRDRPWRNWRLVPSAVRTMLGLRRLFGRFRPHVFVGTGGYVSGPAALVASMRGVPVVLQEQNAYPGVATRWMAPRARQIHLGYPEAREHLRPGAGTDVLDTGNPVRAPQGPIDRAAARAALGMPPGATVALVTGGSQGARAVNETLLEAIALVSRDELPPPPPDLLLLWSTGAANFERVADALRAAGDPAWVHAVGYIDDMTLALAASDLAVSRAGASTTGELLAWGVPSILIPLPTAAADHQRLNAEALAAAGAAITLPQDELTPDALWRTLSELATDARTRASMAEAALRRARPEAARTIAGHILALADAVGAADASRGGSEDTAELDLVGMARTGPVHLIGIAGAGVSVLAELILRSGGEVSGCDLRPGAVGKDLRDRGARIEQGHDADHVEDAVAVITTAAVPASHPELARARARGIPVLKRAEALGALVNRGTVVGIAGTHGKSTTTAMTAAILVEAGLDPTAMVGGRIDAWGSGLRLGARDLFVVEADEYDRSFHELQPTIAVVTNLEADHLDIYGTLEAVEEAFDTYVERVPPGGLLVACADDAGAARLAGRHPDLPVITYGLGEDAAVRAVDVRADGRGTAFTVLADGTELGDLRLSVPGRHNVLNALAALAAARHLGADFDAAARALAEFGGVARRFQVLGERAGVAVVDDYAHHHSELEATLAAARAAFPGRRLIAVFQPHLFSRTRDFAEEMGAALAGADEAWVTDVYPAREAPIEGVSGRLVAEAARAAGAAVRYHPDLGSLPAALQEAAAPGDVLLVMGAGNIDEIASAFFARLGGEVGAS
ncbi:MAG: UDP-N-acetylmuramate--L-alanine ligase [Gemmatimonadota bacterium]